MYEIRTEKNHIRKKYTAWRKALCEDTAKKQAFDERICRAVMSLATYRFADTVMLYAPTEGEIDVLPIAKAALAAGKTVVFPVSDPESCTMKFYPVKDLSQLSPGAFGIHEPPKTEEFLPDGVGRVLCIVPGLVYDENGYRLGYGKGFYDRYFSQKDRSVTPEMAKAKASVTLMGVVYQDCIEKDLPHGKFDLTVDILVTEKGVKSIHAR